MRSQPFFWLFVSMLVLCMLVPCSCFSQEWDDVLQLLSDELQEEETDEDKLSDLQELFLNKVNLNALTEEDCSQFFFLSDFEKQSLLYYINHNYPLFSVYELQFVLGLPLYKAKILAQFCFVAPASKPLPISKLIENGSHTFTCNISSINVSKEEYKDYYNYNGNAVKEVFRYGFQSNNSLYWGVIVEKDMGEKFKLREGFDYQSMYVQIKNRKIISNLILGDYQLSIGQGLTLSQGGFFGSSMEQAGNAQKTLITKHSSANEYNYSKGVAATFKLKNMQITPFYSFRNLDGKSKFDSLFPFTIQKTGYHRTTSEMNAKNAVSYSLIGIHSLVELNRWRLSFSALQHDFSIDSTQSSINNLSASYSYFKRHLRLYGEIATDNKMRLATIHGCQLNIADDALFSVNFRYYESDYQSFMSSAFGRLSNVGNEMGLYFNCNVATGQKSRLIIANDCFMFPQKHTTLSVPAKGNILKLKFTYQNRGISAYCLCSFLRQTSKQNDGSFAFSERYSCKFYGTITINKSLKIKVVSAFNFGEGEVGKLFYQDIVVKPESTLSFSLRFAQFDASYENRLYAWEDDVLYVFASSQYLYQGISSYGVVKWKISERIDFQTKISCSRYTDKYELPESYFLYKGNQKIRCNAVVQITI